MRGSYPAARNMLHAQLANLEPHYGRILLESHGLESGGDVDLASLECGPLAPNDMTHATIFFRGTRPAEGDRP